MSIEENKIIANFMGVKGMFIDKLTGAIIPKSETIQYDQHWDRLMPVWEKIVGLDRSDKKTKKWELSIFRCEVGKYTVFLDCSIWCGRQIGWKHKHFYHSHYPYIDGRESKNLLDAYYKTIIDFINWYNETKKLKA